MGRKVLQFSLALAVLQAVLMITVLNLDMWRRAFVMLGTVPVMTIEVFTLKAKIDMAHGEVCDGLGHIVDKPAFCQQDYGVKDLQDMQNQACASGFKTLAPNLCTGLSGAYVLGICLVIVYACYFLLLATSAWLRYMYMSGSPKKKYRKVALILDVIALLTMSAVLCAYYPFCLMPLDNLTVSPTISTVLSSSSGLGTGKGYIVAWLVPIVQLIIVILTNYSKTSDEARYTEQREQQKMREELEMTGMYGPAGTGQNSVPVGYAPGYDMGYGGQPNQAQQPLSWVAPGGGGGGFGAPQGVPQYGGGGGGYGVQGGGNGGYGNAQAGMQQRAAW